jgi:hypothetical protein
VIVPTFNVPGEGDYWVSRNGNPQVWIDLMKKTQASGQVSHSGITLDPRPSNPELTKPLPLYPSQPDPLLSPHSDAETCSNCHEIHGPTVSCNSRTNYTLVRVSSNGSINSSILLDDEPRDGNTDPLRSRNFSRETLIYPSDSTNSPISNTLTAEGQDLTDSGDGKELDKGIQSLWKVYEEQLSEEEKEKEWG